MRTINVTIRGTEPGLLQHRFPEVVSAQLATPVKPAARVKLSREEDAEMGAYRLSDGGLCEPAEHIFQAMIKAAANFVIQGAGKKTYKDACKGGILIFPEFIPHNQDEYEIDSRPAVIQRARIVRHRPLLRKWELSFDIQVIDDGIPFEVINQILVRAGSNIGIGDYRPRFGRFIVTKFALAD